MEKARWRKSYKFFRLRNIPRGKQSKQSYKCPIFIVKQSYVTNSMLKCQLTPPLNNVSNNLNVNVICTKFCKTPHICTSCLLKCRRFSFINVLKCTIVPNMPNSFLSQYQTCQSGQFVPRLFSQNVLSKFLK